MRRIILLILALVVSTWCYGQQKTENITIIADNITIIAKNVTIIQGNAPDTDSIYYLQIDNLEIPFTKEGDEIISHTGFSLLYNEAHEQADWVAYLHTKEKTKAVVERKDHFRTDPAVKTGSATDKDYTGSGYDRGHLAPAADMLWSFQSMDDSFFYSNMSPQSPSFNRGVWSRLETLVRNWAIEYDSIYVVTGPVLRAGLPSIGPNKVSVPEYYYKAILHYTSKDIKGIGFIVPNEGSSLPLQDFAVSIDSIQQVTGINFFSKLPDKQEKIIEETLCIPCWNFPKK